jgi:hypothetical protein
MYKYESEGGSVDDKIYPNVILTLDNEATLDDQLETFELFLKASGYVFDGELQIVDGDICE